MICIRRRYGLSAAPLMRREVGAVEADRCPTSARSGGAGAARRSSCRSPTRRPGRASRRAGCRSVTPSTAWTWPTVRWRMPPWTGKCLTRSRTSTSGRPPGCGAGAGTGSNVTVIGRSRAPVRPRRRGGRLRAGQEAAVDVVVEPAADVVARADRAELRMDFERVGDVLLDAGQAARREPAAGRQVDQVRDVARDDGELVADLADDRDRADQALRVRVARARGTASRRRSARRSRRRT